MSPTCLATMGGVIEHPNKFGSPRVPPWKPGKLWHDLGKEAEGEFEWTEF